MLPRRLVACALLVALFCGPAAAADLLVVCPPDFRPALAPWLQQRAAQGHQIALLPSAGTADAIRQAVREEAASGEARFLLLVGDVPSPADDAAARRRRVPTHFAPAKVNVRWGSEPQIATDNSYADLDDDQVPDLAVGRLTADSPDELVAMVGKILAYENAASFGRWRQQINFVAGLGGFGALADAVLETCAKKFITEGIPAAYATSMTHASWRSPYCPSPSAFHATTLQRLNEGCLFWVYIGHGRRHELDRIAVPGASYPILERADAARLRCRQGSPIALFLACYAGAFDDPEDCLAESLLRSDGGPVAVVAGSRVTMPYAMAVLGTEMLKECFQNRPATLGELLLAAKRNSAQRSPDDATRQTLDLLASALGSGANLAEERAEHLLLFNLLGDPTLRLPHPVSLELEAPPTAAAGEPLRVSGRAPIDGLATVELVVPRDQLTFKPPVRRRYDPAAASEQYRDVYLRANDQRLASITTRVVDGRFEALLDVPPGVAGPCHVRAYVEGERGGALGAADITIDPPAPPTTAGATATGATATGATATGATATGATGGLSASAPVRSAPRGAE